MKKNNKIFIAVIVALIIAGGSFYGGMQYAGSKNNQGSAVRNGASFQGIRQGTRQNGGNRTAEGFVNGEIIKQDDKSITVKLRDGGSKTVYISDATSISKSVLGIKDDLKIGITVMVNGSTNEDGSVIAQSVQIRSDDLNLPNKQ